jgi:hypothetical protein
MFHPDDKAGCPHGSLRADSFSGRRQSESDRRLSNFYTTDAGEWGRAAHLSSVSFLVGGAIAATSQLAAAPNIRRAIMEQ